MVERVIHHPVRMLQMLATALALSILVGWVAPVYAQQHDTATISGHVVNGTAGAITPQGLTVVLDVFQAGAQPSQITAKTDTMGHFAFDGALVQDGATYHLTVVYLGIGYTVALSSQDNLSDVRVTVYEATSSLEIVSIRNNVMLVLGADAATRTLTLLETLQVANKGDRVFIPNVAQGSVMDLLRFPLPAGAFDLDVQAELPEGQVLQVDRGVALTTPVPPGEHSILLGYKLPYTGESLDISRVFLKGAGSFRLLMPEKVGAASSRALVDRGVTAIGATNFRLLELANISSGAEVDIILDGLPQPSLAGRIRMALPTRSWAIVVPGALLLALATLLAIGLRQGGTPQPVMASSPAQDRASLVQAIAALDDRFHSGDMEEMSYQEQRATLKAQLLRLAWQEEIAHAPATHGNGGEPR